MGGEVCAEGEERGREGERDQDCDEEGVEEKGRKEAESLDVSPRVRIWENDIKRESVCWGVWERDVLHHPKEQRCGGP